MPERVIFGGNRLDFHLFSPKFSLVKHFSDSVGYKISTGLGVLGLNH